MIYLILKKKEIHHKMSKFKLLWSLQFRHFDSISFSHLLGKTAEIKKNALEWKINGFYNLKTEKPQKKQKNQ